jgi:hypothetical protein
MENIKTNDENFASKILTDIGIKAGWKRINDIWFINEDAFNYAKKKHPSRFGYIEFNTAPTLDNEII